MAEEKRTFQAEVSRLLKLMVHSVYSDPEVFLRELISNASDACDKLRYQALTKPELLGEDAEFRIRLIPDKKQRCLEVWDNGIGMSREDLIQELGTIARSGTGAYLEQLTGNDAKDLQLIGQFGVGFYSVFMVADRVTVTSRKAGEEQAWTWESDGMGEYTVGEGSRDAHGTSVVLHLKKAQERWLDPAALRGVVKTYSDHIALPIRLQEDGKEETINQASALWMRPKKEIDEAQYREFYHHVGGGLDDPWLTLHYKAEGKVEYSVLLFVPEHRPYDLFDPARRCRTKLYVKRVFITDECDQLLPPYLRFLRGVVDSEDLPLNISREMLQTSPVLARMRTAITRRVLNELGKKAEKQPEDYARFWDQFGAVLKEGLYEDAERREELLRLARFRSTASDGLVSLTDYVARMKEGQSGIYYITGEDRETLAKSPQLEGFRSRGLEVLLLADPVDDFWITAVSEFDGKPFKSVTRGASDLAEIKREDENREEDAPAPREAEVATLIALLKQSLGEAVKDVRASDRLTESAVCLVADDTGLDMHLERMLRAHNQLANASARVLEINPRHPLIRSLTERAQGSGGKDGFEDVAHLLLDQARIVEGEPVADPTAFARRLASVVQLSLQQP